MLPVKLSYKTNKAYCPGAETESDLGIGKASGKRWHPPEELVVTPYSRGVRSSIHRTLTTAFKPPILGVYFTVEDAETRHLLEADADGEGWGARSQLLLLVAALDLHPPSPQVGLLEYSEGKSCPEMKRERQDQGNLLPDRDKR